MSLAGERSPMRSLGFTLAIASLLAAGCDGAVEQGSLQSARASDRSSVGPPSVVELARVADGYFEAMKADATTLYFGRNGTIYSVPKSGGVVTTLFEEEPANSSATRGMALDEAYVYFTGLGGRRLSRVPKAGGPRELLGDDLDFPGEIAVDADYVYFALYGTLVDEKPTGGVGRMPKAGGVTERLASDQPFVQTLVLSGSDLYFGTTNQGFKVGTATISRVSKTGGAVEAVATGLVEVPLQFAIAGEYFFYAELKSGALMRAPLSGGTPSKVTDRRIEPALATDGASLFVVSLELGDESARLHRVDPASQEFETLAAWSYERSRPALLYPGSGVVYAAVASVVDATHVYWLDYETDDGAFKRSVLRAAPR